MCVFVCVRRTYECAEQESERERENCERETKRGSVELGKPGKVCYCVVKASFSASCLLERSVLC